MKRRKRHNEFLAFLKYLRRKHPTQRLYIITDNFSPHLHHRVQEYCKQHCIHVVFTPTNASWLNKIECHFTPLKEFALKNCYYKSEQEQARAVQQYLQWRNKNKKHPKILKLQKKNNYA